ncbi:MAG: Gfo/Idh/MocA family protein [Fimbriimonadaceae bacterium]
MPIRVGLISTAHVHAPAFASSIIGNPKAELVGIWDNEKERGETFAQKFDTHFTSDLNTLLNQVDAVAIASENIHHKAHISAAISAKKHVLCEKPIAPNAAHAEEIAILAQTEGLVLATAFPCPFSPNFEHAISRIENGDIGTILAVSTTNQGKCPFGWFTNPELSGGGSMIDHVVHVADLIRRLLGEDVASVQAQTGNNHYSENCEDTAMVTVEFTNGVFVTIDSSWSKPPNSSTWGNVKLNMVGEKGIIELDLFCQGLVLTNQNGTSQVGTGSNLDAMLFDNFFDAILGGVRPKSTLQDGLWASQIAIKAYESVAQAGAPAFIS